MQAEARRSEIAKRLKAANGPVSASALAAYFGVSRQIIVGDIALLRASGEAISATPRGYVMEAAPRGIVRRIACNHTPAQMEQELNVIVDNGCTVLDVIVEHPLYGQITGELQLASRYDVSRFIIRCREAKAHPISSLTEGIHLHSIACPSEDAYQRVCDELREQGILLEEQ